MNIIIQIHKINFCLINIIIFCSNYYLFCQVPPPPSEKIGSQYPNLEVYHSNWNTATKAEESIATDPSNGNRILVSTNGYSCENYPYPRYFDKVGAGWYLSTDGGSNWTGDIASLFGPNNGPNNGDPTTAIDLDGTLYVGYITSEYRQGISYSTDNGNHWINKMINVPANKDHLAINLDQQENNMDYRNRLYIAFKKVDEIVFYFTSDKGDTWSSPKYISQPFPTGINRAHGVNLVAGNNRHFEEPSV